MQVDYDFMWHCFRTGSERLRCLAAKIHLQNYLLVFESEKTAD